MPLSVRGGGEWVITVVDVACPRVLGVFVRTCCLECWSSASPFTQPPPAWRTVRPGELARWQYGRTDTERLQRPLRTGGPICAPSHDIGGQPQRESVSPGTWTGSLSGHPLLPPVSSSRDASCRGCADRRSSGDQETGGT